MEILSAVALKGGVGKTTLVHHMAGALALSGRRVLCLDNDPQASLSSGMFGSAAVEALDPDCTIAALYAGEDPLPDQVIRPSGIPGVDVVPGGRAATDFNVPRPHEAPRDAQCCLRSFLDEVRGRYDVALVDNPPNLHLATWAALVASDHFLVACIPEDYGTTSLRRVFESVALVAAGPNPGLHMLGLVLTMVQARLAVHQLYEATLREIHGDGVYSARIPLAADIKEAISRRVPVTHHKPRGASTKAFKALVEETYARIAAHAGGRGRGAA